MPLIQTLFNPQNRIDKAVQVFAKARNDLRLVVRDCAAAILVREKEITVLRKRVTTLSKARERADRMQDKISRLLED